MPVERRLLDRARRMRRDSTEAERLLWRHLRNRQLCGLKFRRQVPLDGYIVDFLCDAARLIIEIDGGQHAQVTNYELERTRILEQGNWRVLRFWNNEVIENIEGVLTVISTAASHRRRCE